jgi:PAS domain S-box-containing protein
MSVGEPTQRKAHPRPPVATWRRNEDGGDEQDALAYVLDASGVGHWRVDIATGRTWLSSGCKASFGVAADDDDEIATLVDLERFIHPDDLDSWRLAFERALTGAGEYALEHRIVTVTKQVRWFVVRGRVCRCPSGGRVMAGLIVDITSHKALEEERERLIGELAAERARLRAVIDHMPAAVVMSEASGRVVLTNRNVETVFPSPYPSVPVAAEVAFAALPALHPDGRPVGFEERPLTRALRGESASNEEYRYCSPDGREAWLRLSSAPIRDDEGRIAGGVVIATNIDEEKRAEEMLRATERRQRLLFDSPVIGIMQSHVDGRLIDANDTFLHMLGYTREDLLAGRLNWRTLTPPEHLDGNERRLEELLSTGFLRLCEKAYLRADGSSVPVVIGGVMLAGPSPELVTFTLDISDRKRADAERESLLRSLELSEERYRLVVSATEDAVYEVDLRTNTIDAHVMRGHIGVTSKEGWAALVHPADRDVIVEGLNRTLASGEAHWQAEYRMLRADGSWAVVMDRAQVVFGDDGAPRRLVGAIQDITARRTQEEFERQLVGIVSHDLKNPLNTILLAAEMLARTGGLGETATRNAKRIERAAARATRMINDLLDFTRARLGTGIPIERRHVGLATTFRSLVDEVRVGHPARTIHFSTNGDCSGSFDADRLAQVLTNLVDNALKYGPPETPVSVTLRSEADTVCFSVENEGPAIPTELLPRIFEPLQRGDTTAFDPSSGRSVGLGLYIVKNLVEAHGGVIDVSSDGVTTRFAVCLPRSAASI